jgi:hypothetical protein
VPLLAIGVAIRFRFGASIFFGRFSIFFALPETDRRGIANRQA